MTVLHGKYTYAEFKNYLRLSMNCTFVDDLSTKRFIWRGGGRGGKTSKGEGMVEHLFQILAKPTSR